MIHKLKTWPIPFQLVKDGIKNYEVRKNDRFFKKGDELLLEEFTPKDYWDPEEPMQDEYTGEILHRKVTHVLRGNQFGIKKGYVILSIEKI